MCYSSNGVGGGDGGCVVVHFIRAIVLVAVVICVCVRVRAGAQVCLCG